MSLSTSSYSNQNHEGGGSGGSGDNDNTVLNDGIVMSSGLWNHYEACPNHNEEYIISIICGNSRCHWSLHESYDRQYYPNLYWKTPPPIYPTSSTSTTNSNNHVATTTSSTGTNSIIPTATTASTTTASPTDSSNAVVAATSMNANEIPKLYDFLPYVVKDMIYGKQELIPLNNNNNIQSSSDNNNKGGSSGPQNNKVISLQLAAAVGVVAVKVSDDKYCTSTRAATNRSIYRIPSLSIYIISTNILYRNNIIKLLKDAIIPCRIFILKNHDFTTTTKLSSLPKTISSTTTNTSSSSTDQQHSSNISNNDQEKKKNDIQEENQHHPYYYTMGIDRIVSLLGGQYLLHNNNNNNQNIPLLIIDGGTAMTYTGTNHNGTFIGGGIGCGLRMKFRSLYDYTNSLPYINYDILYQYIQHAITIQKQPQQKQPIIIPTIKPKVELPLSCFVMNTEHALITSILRETILHLIHIISTWIKEHSNINWNELVMNATTKTKVDQQQQVVDANVVTPVVDTTSATTMNDDVDNNENESSLIPTIILSGGDGKIYQLLLQENHSGIIQTMEQQDDNGSTTATMLTTIRYAIQMKIIKLIYNQHLLHHGIQSMLLQRDEMKYKQREINLNIRNSTTTIRIREELWIAREELIGQRIAMIPGMGDITLISIIQGLSDIPKRAVILYGIILNIIPSDDNKNSRNTLDKDLFIIFWDTIPPSTTSSTSSKQHGSNNNNNTKDHHIEYNVTPRKIYDYLILYTKANEKLKEKDPERQIKLEKKAIEAKDAAVLLASKSDSVKALIDARLAAAKANAARKNVTTSSAAAAGVAAAVAKTTTTSTSDSAPVTATLETILNNKKRNAGSTSIATTATTDINDNNKKAKTQSQEQQQPLILPQKQRLEVMNWNSKDFIKKRVAKNFDGQVYFGVVKKWVPASENDEGVDLWLVEYDDGDSEDLEKKELVDCIIKWTKNSTRDQIHSLQKQHNQKQKHSSA